VVPGVAVFHLKRPADSLSLPGDHSRQADLRRPARNAEDRHRGVATPWPHPRAVAIPWV